MESPLDGDMRISRPNERWAHFMAPGPPHTDRNYHPFADARRPGVNVGSYVFTNMSPAIELEAYGVLPTYHRSRYYHFIGNDGRRDNAEDTLIYSFLNLTPPSPSSGNRWSQRPIRRHNFDARGWFVSS